MTLELLALEVRLGARALLPPVTLRVAPGQVATLMGPSGIGKSTLLDAIGGHLGPDFTMRGQVLVAGREVTALPPEARRIGLMFQDARLFPHLSVAGNLAFGLHPRHRKDRAARVAQALADAGMDGFGPRDPATLSGGERARVALMRALLAEPLALLLDEPFSRLDAALRADLRGFVFDHLRRRGIPALMVTHDREDATAAAGPVLEAVTEPVPGWRPAPQA
jgi:putative thiamine transport system ATP-binding protein